MNLEQTLGEMPTLALQAEPDPLEGQFESAKVLASDIAGRINRDMCDVWNALCHVPDNMLCLLSSPEGWIARAGFVAGDLGASAASYMPTIH